jgi:peptidyl-prolyl cis-trans isomerase C
MRSYRNRAVATVCAAMLAVALPASAQDTPPADENPVEAVVNGQEIRRSDVLDSARTLPPAYQQQIDQIYPALVERLIDLTLLLEEAKRRDLGADPEVQARVAEYEDQVVREILLDRQVKEGMTEEAVKARYDQFVTEFQPQTEIRARHILVATEDEAKAIIAELDAGGDFATIAQTKSVDTGSGAQGGDLGFFTAEQMVPEFSQAAFALEPGTHSTAPVQSQFGWHVIKVEEKRDTQPPSFEESRPELENQLSQELVNELVARLRADADIQITTPPPADPAATDPAAEDPAAAEPTPAEGETEETAPAQ